MRNKLLINIVIANLLWSFIPIVVSGLFLEVSIIMVIFLRFLISGIILFLLALILTLLNNRFTDNKEIPLKLLFTNLFRSNRRFYHIKNIYYYWLVGFFGIILHLIFFFLTLKTTSIIFTMIGFLLSIILIALYDKGVNFEKFDIFKVLYIIMLVFTIIILAFIGIIGGNLKGKPITFNGILYLLVFSITISFLYISINRDAFSKDEAKLITKNKYYRIPRFLIKMSVSFLLGTLSMIPFILIFTVLPFPNELKYESTQFFIQLFDFSVILGRWEILYLIIFSTLIPYILIFIANTFWKSEHLTYSQWSSILNLIDPMGSILFSVILINEYFPFDMLIITIFLLVITIVFRYAHETKNLVKAYILISLKKGEIKSTILKILKYNGVISVYALIGTFDLLVDVKVSSIRDLYSLVDNRLKPIDEVKNLEILFINKTEKLSN
ncbi:MAG: Lrp/AsnC ligand binding domain-containing protein [Candidatus Thorarchaeota archaeon]